MVEQNCNNQPLSPFVYWAQTKQRVTLRVDLKDAKCPVVEFTPNAIKFKAKGCGAKGFNEYQFHMDFYDLINDEECTYRVYDNKIDCCIEKNEKKCWPRLVATPQKPHWLKIDFDRWHTDDDEIEEKPRDILQDYAKEYKRLQKEEVGYIKENTKKVYMILYNLVQFVGFLHILCVLAVLYYRDVADAKTKAYESVGKAMKFVQLLQYLEVLHPIFGYTKGSPIIPFMQVSGRNLVLFIIIEGEQRMQTKPAVFYIFIIWSLIEVIRYPYYLSTIIKKEFGFLTWLRYTAWIPLYPMGILCEGVIILRSIFYFEETAKFSVTLPNRWNFVFDMPTFLKLYLLLLILPGTYVLISHMAKVRSIKLSRNRRIRKYSN